MSAEAGSSASVMLPGAVRVLVVDDDPVARQHTATGLERAGFQVLTADDGALAMVQAGATPPDVAIVDLEMPTSGYDVVRHLKLLHGPAVHVIVLTGHDDEQTRAKAFEAGTDDFLVKPTPMAELRRRLVAASRTQQAYVDARIAREQADRRIAYGAEAIALLAHDLNNGLAVALSNLTYLFEVFGEAKPSAPSTVGPDEVDAIAATMRSLRKMSGLVANFVDIARFEDAAVKPLRVTTSIEDLIRSVQDVHAPSTSAGVTFAIDVPDRLTGVFDPGLIERVLHNLVGNALRYCPPSGRIQLRARRWRDDDAGSVDLTVANSGPLIPESVARRLFAKYGKGTGGKRGMGLYFCRLACEAHGGSIEYAATSDGPSFVIRIPGHG